MTLTADDKKMIKDLLDEQRKAIVGDIERRISTAETNLEREIGRDGFLEDNKTIVRLRREIQTSEARGEIR